jgi:hypothetical protein
MTDIIKLQNLLEKISKTTDRVHIEVNYNGKEFFWRILIPDITADEYVPKNSKRDEREHR